jgi:hypothetical protein
MQVRNYCSARMWLSGIPLYFARTRHRTSHALYRFCAVRGPVKAVTGLQNTRLSGGAVILTRVLRVVLAIAVRNGRPMTLGFATGQATGRACSQRAKSGEGVSRGNCSLRDMARCPGYVDRLILVPKPFPWEISFFFAAALPHRLSLADL